MHRHEVFRKNQLKKVNVNLILFYFLAIVVSISRFLSMIGLYLSVKKNDYRYMDYYNYGFYTATFSIILIAVSQINSINTATLRTRYVNEYMRKPGLSTKNLDLSLTALNVGTVLIDLATLVYYSLTIFWLHGYL